MPEIIPRQAWTSRTPKDMTDVADEIDGLPNFDDGELLGVVYHWPGIRSTQGRDLYSMMRDVQRVDMDTKKYSDVMYNLFVNPWLGDVIAGRGLVNKGAANGDSAKNAKWLSVNVMIGIEDEIPDMMLTGMRLAREFTMSRWPGANQATVHKAITATSCPGPDIEGFVTSGAVLLPSAVDVRPKRCTLPKPILKEGDRGAAVMELQEALAFWNFYNGRVDGKFGPVTRTALLRLQKFLRETNPDWFPKVAAQGVYGRATRRGFCKFIRSIDEAFGGA